MINLLVICGPTGTGKTALGIRLGQVLKGEVVSADSRQVYKDFTIGTGKLLSTTTPIWGYDLAQANEEFTVAHFKSFATKMIQEISQRKRLPILVGGTGLYISAVVNNFHEVGAPRDERLRSELSKLSAEEMFERLSVKFPRQASLLNASDRKNPVRILRAFERASYPRVPESASPYNVLTIGLRAPLEVLYSRIESSVHNRIERGFEKEVRELLDSGVSIHSKPFTATGYREFAMYLNGLISQHEAILKWIQAEKKYVKRQLIWFKKQKDVNWFDISKQNYQSEVEEFSIKWHNRGRHE